MPKIYELRDEGTSALSFHPTRKEAEKEQRWWTNEGGVETTIHSIEYKAATKAGVAELLTRIATAH